MTMANDTYEVYAVHYGHHDRQSSVNYIGGDTHDVLQPLDYYVWAIVGRDRIFVLDTGFDAEMGAKRRRTLVRPIGEGLKTIGINPDTIEDVIVSHLHFDHTGNYALFPRAKYHLQDTEIAYATGRCMCHPYLKAPFEEEDVIAMVRKVFAGRVVFHDGTDEIAPGITVHKVGGHSKGLQCVRVKTRRGHVVLASDATHLYSHFEEGRVFPTTYNPAEVLEGYNVLRKLASSSAHIIPGHDPAVLKRYPAAKSGLEGWVVRLDAEPSEAL
jgi:glyoxylase-like metal-dependent hydrolase (beta-lactamase superfamily II)